MSSVASIDEIEAIVAGIYGSALVVSHYSGSDAGEAATKNLRAFVERLASIAIEARADSIRECAAVCETYAQEQIDKAKSRSAATLTEEDRRAWAARTCRDLILELSRNAEG